MTVCPEDLLISFSYFFFKLPNTDFQRREARCGFRTLLWPKSWIIRVAWAIVYICMCIRLESDVIMGWWNKLEKPVQSLKWTVWVSRRLKDGVIWRSVLRYKDSSQERNRLYDFTSGFREHELSPQLLERQKCERHSHTQGEAALSIPGITARWQTILTLSSEPVQLNGCSV